MSKARSMYAGSSGSNYGVNKNSPGNGNGKWQGLPPITNMRSLLIPYINTRARGDNRDVVFCMNQLGGVGKRSNMFASNADGVHEPCQREELTPCEEYGEALLGGDDGRPSLRSTLRGAKGRTDGGLLGSSLLGRYGASQEWTLLQDDVAKAARTVYPIRRTDWAGATPYKLTLYQGAVPPLAGKEGSKTAYIDYQTAMFEWAKAKNVDRVFLDLSSLDTYKQQTVDNLVAILSKVDPRIQVGVLNEAQPGFVFQTGDPDLQKARGGMNPDPATWKVPGGGGDCSKLLDEDVKKGTKKCIGEDGKPPLCNKPINTAEDYANGNGSCKCSANPPFNPAVPNNELGCWTEQVCTDPKDPDCKYKQCKNPLLNVSGCPNQLQVSYSFIAAVNRGLQAQKSPGGYITCVIADKENGDYAQNILLSVASAHTILRPSLPTRLQKCMEVGLAGQGSMTPGGIIISSLLYCCQNQMAPSDEGKGTPTNPESKDTIEDMFLVKGPAGTRTLRAPYNDILITTYPELYWYMNDLKPLGCVGCDHTLSADSLKAKSSADCLAQSGFKDQNGPVYKKYNQFWDHNTMAGGDDAKSIQAQCLADINAPNEEDRTNAELCGCLGCVSCKYSNPNAGPGGTSVAPGMDAGDPPNMHIPYQRYGTYGPYGDKGPDLFASEIWNTKDGDPDPYKARIYGTQSSFTNNLYGMRAMFSNEVSHNWGSWTRPERIDGRFKNHYSCVARRMGADTCGTFDGFSTWSWDHFSKFLDSFAGQPNKGKDGNLQELAIYEWQFVSPEWIKGTPAEQTLADYPYPVQ